MPYPQNLQTALEVEAVVRQHGAVPATIAIIGGQPCIGGPCTAVRIALGKLASIYICRDRRLQWHLLLASPPPLLTHWRSLHDRLLEPSTCKGDSVSVVLWAHHSLLHVDHCYLTDCHAGCDNKQLEYIAQRGTAVRKVSRRDMPLVVGNGLDGATTVSGTMLLAARAGIKVFVTGGIGGVHRWACSSSHSMCLRHSQA